MGSGEVWKRRTGVRYFYDCSFIGGFRQLSAFNVSGERTCSP